MSRPALAASVREIRAAGDRYEIVVEPEHHWEPSPTSEDPSAVVAQSIVLSADQAAARRYRVGDLVEVVIFKRSKREEQA